MKSKPGELRNQPMWKLEGQHSGVKGKAEGKSFGGRCWGKGTWELEEKQSGLREELLVVLLNSFKK